MAKPHQKEARAVQMRRVHALGKQLGLDHNRLSEICQENQLYQKQLRYMSERQLRELATWLQSKINIARSQLKEPVKAEKPKKYVWTKQDKRIFAMGFDLNWKTKDLRGFFKRTVGKTELKEMTIKEKSSVIVGLTKIIEGFDDGNNTN